MIFDTIAALADYLNNGKFDNSATKAQCEESVRNLLTTNHETLTVGERILLNNELEKFGVFSYEIQYRTPRSEYESEVSNLESSSSASSSSSSGSSSDPYQAFSLFYIVNNSFLEDLSGNTNATVVAPAETESDYIRSPIDSSGGYITSNSVLTIHTDYNWTTFGFWVKGIITIATDKINHPLYYASYLSKGNKEKIGINVGVPAGPLVHPELSVGDNINTWRFVVCQWIAGSRMGYGRNGIWLVEQGQYGDPALIVNGLLDLSNLISFGENGAINGMFFIQNTVLTWAELEAIALSTKPTGAVMW